MLNVYLDFETFYGPGYSLQSPKISTMDYVRSDLFESQGLSVRIGNSGRTKYFCGPNEVAEAMQELIELQKQYKINLIAFNTKFDALICAERYGFTPDYYTDVKAIAKGLWPHHPNSLEHVAKRVFPKDKTKHKLDGLETVKGVRYKDFTEEQKRTLATYCIRDTDIMVDIYLTIKDWLPQFEHDVINITTRMFVEPEFVLDFQTMRELSKEINHRQAMLLNEMTVLFHEIYPEIQRKTFTSNKRFADFLVNGLGIPENKLPTKISKTTGKVTHAFGKNDVPYIEFAKQYPHYRFIFNTRQELNSSIAKSRAESLVRAATGRPDNDQKLCVPLVYYQAHTGRYGGNEGINLQNLQRGSKHRLALTAPAGSQVLVYDSSNIEARMLAWFAGEHSLLEQYRNGDDVYSTLASKIYHTSINKRDNPGERSIGKVACIAEGQRVLTDQGLIPIEKITLEHRLWDGVSFVNHDGLIYKGKKEVITYDGLTATPDHIVFTQKGHQIPFGRAASQMERLKITGNDGQTIRSSKNNFSKSIPSSRWYVQNAMPMSNLWNNQTDLYKQSNIRKNPGVSKLLTNHIETFRKVGQTVRCNSRSYSKPFQSWVQKLWGAWNKELVQITPAFYRICNTTTTPFELHRSGYRQNRQQRALRTGEYSISFTQNQYKQQTNNQQNKIQRYIGTSNRYSPSESLCLYSNSTVFSTRIILEPSNTKSDSNSNKQTQKLETDKTKVRVYDILNAGPRHRFTVEGRLVHNCLGLGYQMGIPRFKETLESGPMGMPPMDCTYEFAEKVVSTYRKENPRIVQSWKTAQNMIREMTLRGNSVPWGPLTVMERCIMLPNGMFLQYPDLSVTEVETMYGTNYEYNYKAYDFKSKKFVEKKIYGGKLIENIIQALSRIVIMEQMVQIDAMLKKFNGKVVLQVHDEIICIVPDEFVEQAEKEMQKIMSNPPSWCPDLPLACEGGYDINYSK